MNLRDILDFLQIDDDAIRFFIYGGTGSVVSGVVDKKKVPYLKFVSLAFVGAVFAAFAAPSIIVYYDIKNVKYQMLVGFLVGMGSMIIIGKIINWFKSINLKSEL